MSTDVNILMEMGFPKNRAEKALHKTNYKGAQVAMDWLFDHSEDPDIDEPFEAPKGFVLGDSGSSGGDAGSDKPVTEPEAAVQQPEATAKSLKCDDCGKLLKSELDAQAHAARTQHSNFSESTEEIRPLTEEEKKQQLEKLQERRKQKRLEKEEQEKQEQILREKQRRATGKEMGSIKQKMQEDEMKKIAEQRRREKREEQLAKQRVREQIEKDKRDRAAKFPKHGEQLAAAAATASPANTPAVSEPPADQPKKEYDQCRLQIRLTNGKSLTQSFGVKEPLAAVRLYIEMNRTDGAGPFALMTSFPRKVFNEQEMEKPLYDLGLVPSAVLIVTKTT